MKSIKKLEAYLEHVKQDYLFRLPPHSTVIAIIQTHVEDIKKELENEQK